MFYGRFSIFKMTAVRHLGFAKVENFNFRSGLEAHCASYAKFREDRSNRSGDMADFRFFKMAAAAILDLLTCIWTIHEEHLLVFVTVQNLVEIGAVVLIICQF